MWQCWFLHKWGSWTPVYKKYGNVYWWQDRTCSRCGKTIERVL